MPPLGEDEATLLIELLDAVGAVAHVNALGNVAAGPVVLPDPMTAALTTLTLTASGVGYTLPNPNGQVGKKVRVLATQDATGSRTLGTITVAGGGSVAWVGAAAPTLTTTAAHADLLEFESYDGVNYVGSSKLNIH